MVNSEWKRGRAAPATHHSPLTHHRASPHASLQRALPVNELHVFRREPLRERLHELVLGRDDLGVHGRVVAVDLLAAVLEVRGVEEQQALDVGADAALTLVAAPPGYGKTTAVRAWCAEQASALAWVLVIVAAIVIVLIFKTSSRWVYYESEGG